MNLDCRTNLQAAELGLDETIARVSLIYTAVYVHVL